MLPSIARPMVLIHVLFLKEAELAKRIQAALKPATCQSPATEKLNGDQTCEW
jgi:hypothetical protein